LRVFDDARVVDQRVDAPPLGHHAFDHDSDALLVGDIDDEPDGLAAGGRDERDRALDGRRVDIASRDFRAFLGKLDRGRLADALAGAGDDRDVVLQAHVALHWIQRGSQTAGAGSRRLYSK
jgi:hypothetical protein